MNWTHSERLDPEICAWAEDAAAIRHDIHAHPELGFETSRTCGLIVEALKSFGIGEVDDRIVPGGVIAVIEGTAPGRTIALRADMDALAMPDGSDNPWSSTVQCRAHACGHDGHTAWLLLAARALQSRRAFKGRVVLIFQPAEEIGRGALAVVESGIFEKYGIEEVYGAHIDSSAPVGQFGFRAGPAQASCDFFYIDIEGKGVHASRPHLGIDPLPAAALLVNSLQTIVSRHLDPFEPAVVSLCSLESGAYGAPNVIPNGLRMSGTVRTFSEEVREQIHREIALMTEHAAAAQGCRGSCRIDRLTSVVVNDAALVKACRTLAAGLWGEDQVFEPKAVTGGEDFAEYQKKCPGVMFRVGGVDEGHQAFCHNPAFDFNDRVLPSAAQFFCELVKARLGA